MLRNASRFAACGKQTPSGACSPTNNISDNVRYVRLLRKAAILIVSFGRLQAGGPLASQTGPPSFSGAFARESVRRSRFRLSQAFSPPRLTSKFVSSLFVASPPPGNSAGRAPAHSPSLAVVAPQGGGVRKRLSASSGLRSRVFSLRARPAFDRASAPAVSLFGVSFVFAFKVF